MFDTSKAIQAQEKLCEEKGYPHFAPRDGRCWSCRRNIYEEYERPSGYKTGVQVEKASTELITGCPHCNRTYCD